VAESRFPPLWSPEALSDIDQLWDYYAEVAGRATAAAILRDIEKVVVTITDHLLAG
jgi:plasmid stabilization system protein ParE